MAFRPFYGDIVTFQLILPVQVDVNTMKVYNSDMKTMDSVDQCILRLESQAFTRF